MFQKAKPQQARLKMSIYGAPGSGKTFSTLLFAEGLARHRGKRIAYVDTERGTDFYAQSVSARPVHPDAFDFDAIYTKSLSDVLAAVKSLDVATHGVIVIDSMSHLWDAAIAAYEGKKTKIDTIPMQAWGQIKRPYKELVSFLIGSPFDVFILGRQKNVFEDDADDKMRKVGVAMRAEGETAYEPHLCARMDLRRDGESSFPVMFVEKDRTGVLQGRTFAKPDFQTIAPLLPLLGDVQASAEDEDERIARDGELLSQGEDKAAKKAEKSAGFLAQFTAAIASCTDVQALGAVAADIKKQKRYILDEHANALRVHYESARNRLTLNAAPEAI